MRQAFRIRVGVLVLLLGTAAAAAEESGRGPPPPHELPCNAFCRAWLGRTTPPPPMVLSPDPAPPAQVSTPVVRRPTAPQRAAVKERPAGPAPARARPAQVTKAPQVVTAPDPGRAPRARPAPVRPVVAVKRPAEVEPAETERTTRKPPVAPRPSRRALAAAGRPPAAMILPPSPALRPAEEVRASAPAITDLPAPAPPEPAPGLGPIVTEGVPAIAAAEPPSLAPPGAAPWVDAPLPPSADLSVAAIEPAPPAEPATGEARPTPVDGRMADLSLPPPPRTGDGLDGTGSLPASTGPVEEAAPPAAAALPSVAEGPQADWVLYLAVQDQVRAVSDLSGRSLALGTREPLLEEAVRRALGQAGVAPAYKGGPDADALGLLAAGEADAALLYAGPPLELNLTGLLDKAGLRVLEVPMLSPEPR